jgi:hypothetical protein
MKVCMFVLVAALLPSAAQSQTTVDVSPSYFQPWDHALSLSYYADFSGCEYGYIRVEIDGSDGFYYDSAGWGSPFDGNTTDWGAPTSQPNTISYSLWADWLPTEESNCEDETDYDYASSDPAPSYAYSLFLNSQVNIVPSQVTCTRAGCDGVTKWETQRRYQIVDQWGRNYQYTTWVTEDIQVNGASGVCASGGIALRTGGDWSTGDGQIFDYFAICDDQCCLDPNNPCQVDLTQYIGLNYQLARIYSVGFSCSQVTVQ